MDPISTAPTPRFCLDDSPEFQYIQLGQVGSTNQFLKQFAPPAPRATTLVTAEWQTHGRGAGSNSWESQAGENLLMSLMIRPAGIPASRMFGLSQALALAVRATVGHYAAHSTIKWPNDIYVEDRKVAGLLIENDLVGKMVERSIMGVGLNVNQTRFLSDAPNPASLAQIAGHRLERRQVLECFMAEWGRFSRLLQSRPEEVHRQYLHNLYRWHQPHHYRDGQGTFLARIVYVEPTGHLCLADSEGHMRHYAFKEVEYIINHTKQ